MVGGQRATQSSIQSNFCSNFLSPIKPPWPHLPPQFDYRRHHPNKGSSFHTEQPKAKLQEDYTTPWKILHGVCSRLEHNDLMLQNVTGWNAFYQYDIDTRCGGGFCPNREIIRGQNPAVPFFSASFINADAYMPPLLPFVTENCHPLRTEQT